MLGRSCGPLATQGEVIIVADLCTELSTLSKEINTWLSAQPAVKEESLTDWLLYELSKRSSQVYYKAFTRHEEAKYTGADWDWLFVFNDGSIRIRIQAKKLFENKDNQPELLRSNQYGRQIDKLISSSKKKKILPMYAFFSANNSPTACKNKLTKSDGTFLCGADSVLNNLTTPKRTITPSDALTLSYPLPCITCCSLIAKSDSAKDLIQQIHQYFPSPESISGDQDDLMGYSQVTPQFALNILDNNGVFPEWWEEEYKREFEEVNAVVIVDKRS